MDDFGETLVIERHHVVALAETLAASDLLARPGHRGARLREAAQRLTDAISGQEDDALAWIVPAAPLALLAHYADGLGVYRLDECEAASYAHPGVAAEHVIAHAVATQAPRTDAAMSVVLEAETILLLATP